MYTSIVIHFFFHDFLFVWCFVCVMFCVRDVLFVWCFFVRCFLCDVFCLYCMWCIFHWSSGILPQVPFFWNDENPIFPSFRACKANGYIDNFKFKLAHFIWKHLKMSIFNFFQQVAVPATLRTWYTRLSLSLLYPQKNTWTTTASHMRLWSQPDVVQTAGW